MEDLFTGHLLKLIFSIGKFFYRKNEIILLRQKRKQHLKKITDLFGCPDKTLIIHYSCTNFEETPIRIGSISVLKLNETKIESFFLEGAGAEESEKLMLEKFIAFIKNNKYATYINWNMRDNGYGFPALQIRFNQLIPGSESSNLLSDLNQYDLSEALHEMYGDNYIEHNKQINIFRKNNLNINHFLGWKDEIRAIDNKHFQRLSLSTNCKVKNLKDIFTYAYEGKLKTNISWFKNFLVTYSNK